MLRFQYTDRELSWLDFNERVLELAEDENLPLLERARFLAIFASNLDEFYMVRVATLKELIAAGVSSSNSAGYSPTQLMSTIADRAKNLAKKHSDLFQNEINPLLKNLGIELVNWKDLEEDEIIEVNGIFERLIFPVLTPLAVDPSRPFPYISGLSLNLAVVVRQPGLDEESFARIKVPTNLPRFIPTRRGVAPRYLPLEQVIAAQLHQLFPGMEILDHHAFRLTRNADLDLEEEETDSLISTLEQELQRRRFGPPVRLEVDENIKPELLVTLADEMDIDLNEVIRVSEPLDLTALNFFADFEVPGQRFGKFSSVSHAAFSEIDNDDPDAILHAIRSGEVLLHHPYESFSNSVVRFVQQAARDPQVLAIKQTLYRTSGDSPLMEALIEAAASGKQVLAVVELRARFDELANVRWARKLEEAGVHVVYGLLGFKTHAKLSLVVREEANGIRRYCHVGTGNYNPKTARIYDDLGILSADPELGEDLTRLFNQLSGYAPDAHYSRLLVAPRTIRSGLLDLIDLEVENHQAGRPARIRMKLNSLVDEQFCDHLYQASQAGVPIELWVRGICAIQPGIPGVSDQIRVRSTLGRFLEHSRIFHFANGGTDEYFIGSADLMERNLDRRVEALVRIKRPEHKIELDRQFVAAFSDEVSRWELTDGTRWVRKHKDESGQPLIDLQEAEISRRRGRQ
ncbi:MAG: RNA degradosome polyphosphate kinase [Actinobacteria bacterium]|nr:RNA degradosome polyphosphate kinase [Actinomycetota bacterium]NDI09439.1 RNA degradosome polyphosphate kinase [Actinomycetota bacterium]